VNSTIVTAAEKISFQAVHVSERSIAPPHHDDGTAARAPAERPDAIGSDSQDRAGDQPHSTGRPSPFSHRRGELQQARDHIAAAKLKLAEYALASGVARTDAELAALRVQDLQHATLAKTQLLYALSHEFRTPLNAIIGYAEILQLGLRGQMTSAQTADVSRIKRAGDYLLSLVNDVLTVARLERSQIPLRPAAIRIHRAIAEAVELCSLQASTKDVALDVDVRDDGMAVFADRDRLQQILLNLITNSLKFTTAGGTVTVTADADDAMVRVHIADTGRGIAETDLERVFEPFVQIEPHLTRDVEQGAGLGLAISRDLALVMRGTLTLESGLGKGSVFTLSLPIAIVPPAEESVPSASIDADDPDLTTSFRQSSR
jgi:signal transduction histidine kinase